ncbi:hypothetical protein [Allokutzneria oryzae]|uniref:Uncharacterized protein n=1 Tax=Allokutzneria oryzae TaxID=1378989 RepID=A0ABV5ZVG2_9PSEU
MPELIPACDPRKANQASPGLFGIFERIPFPMSTSWGISAGRAVALGAALALATTLFSAGVGHAADELCGHVKVYEHANRGGSQADLLLCSPSPSAAELGPDLRGKVSSWEYVGGTVRVCLWDSGKNYLNVFRTPGSGFENLPDYANDKAWHVTLCFDH